MGFIFICRYINTGNNGIDMLSFFINQLEEPPLEEGCSAAAAMVRFRAPNLIDY
jgi:hypothetical protein